MSDTSQLDKLLAEKSRELARAEERFNIQLIPVLTAEIDELLDRRKAATIADINNATA